MRIFPIHRLRPETIKADVVPQVISGGVALNGDEDVVQTDGGGRWEIVFGGISLNTVEKQRIWDAWTSYLCGGARAILVPVYSMRTAPRPFAGGGLMRPSAIDDDDEVFPESVTLASPMILAEAVGDNALRATAMTILVTQGARLQPGMRFSYGDHAYKIEDTIGVGMEVPCVISPPLREEIPDGAALNFDWPVTQCRAVIGQDLSPEMRWGRQGTTSVAFVEDFSA